MRHGVKSKKLKRSKSHRKALLKNLSKQLLHHGRIKTTLVKAKLLRQVVEPLITRAKKGTMHDRRYVFSVIEDKKVVKKLFEEVAPLYKERNGGYTRILKMENRAGDNAEVGIIELVDREKVYKKEEKKKAGEKGKKTEKSSEKEEKKEKKDKKDKK